MAAHPPAKPARKPRAPRKPRDARLMRIHDTHVCVHIPDDGIAWAHLSAGQARGYASWLIRAADWLDAQAQRPRGKGRGR